MSKEQIEMTKVILLIAMINITNQKLHLIFIILLKFKLVNSYTPNSYESVAELNTKLNTLIVERWSNSFHLLTFINSLLYFSVFYVVRTSTDALSCLNIV